MIRTGTSYFRSFTAAYGYYRAYGCTPADVKAKLDAGEIHLGKPVLKPGQRLELIDNLSRYAIVEG